MSEVFQVFFTITEIIGTIAFAASGAMLAIDRGLDLFGVIFLGITTAVGGGILRDVLMGVLPPVAFTNSTYVLVAFLTALVVFVFAWRSGRRYWRERAAIDRVMNLLDALGLGVFSAVGVQTAMVHGFAENAFLCIFMGMSTGVGGGILRDMMSRTVPAVLQKHIYALASIAGSGLYYVLIQLSADGTASMLAAMAITVMIRLLSTYYMWNLPHISKEEEPESSKE